MTETPIKSLKLCDGCFFGIGNAGCPGEKCTDEKCTENCPMADTDGLHCLCALQEYGKPCEYYRPLEGNQNEAD